MKKLLYLFILCSCGAGATKNTSTADKVQDNIQAYMKARTTNPELYKPLETSPAIIVKDTLLIKDFYTAKQLRTAVNFDSAIEQTTPPAAEIKEKYYELTHSYEEQNKFGAIVQGKLILYLDDSSNVVSSFRLK